MSVKVQPCVVNAPFVHTDNLFHVTLGFAPLYVTLNDERNMMKHCLIANPLNQNVWSTSRMKILFSAQSFGMQSSKLHHSHVCFVGVYSRLWTYPNGSRMSQSGSRELSSTTLRTCSNTPTRTKSRSMLPVRIKAALVAEETRRMQSDLVALGLLWLSLH